MNIFLVEDDHELAQFLIKGFQGEGHQVTHAATGQEALDKIDENLHSVIVLDLILPDLNGAEVLSQYKDRGIDLPVIVLTALSDLDSKVKLLNMGADDYLSKPFSFVELNVRINALLRRGKKTKDTSQSDIVIKDICIKPKTRSVSKAGKEIKLRMKEYDLLHYLVKHADQVIPRSTLIERVWDYDSRVISNTVDSHVSILRKKLDLKKEDKLIETVHGIGYILRTGSEHN